MKFLRNNAETVFLIAQSTFAVSVVYSLFVQKRNANRLAGAVFTAYELIDDLTEQAKETK